MNYQTKSWQLSNFYYSQIGKKLLTGLTGLGLTVFIIFHLLGNLLLLQSKERYNQFAHWLENLSFLFHTIELTLGLFFLIHIISGISIHLRKLTTRKIAYIQYQSAGKPSLQSFSSNSMIWTGLILMVFLIFHLSSFKYGTYYLTTINGVEMRDLARLVIEKFQQPIYTFPYLAVMLILGFHLRHGIWSACQSLGIINSSIRLFLYSLALILAILIFFGFIIIPLFIYLRVIA